MASTGKASRRGAIARRDVHGSAHGFAPLASAGATVGRATSAGVPPPPRASDGSVPRTVVSTRAGSRAASIAASGVAMARAALAGARRSAPRNAAGTSQSASAAQRVRTSLT